jgi:hypothetical protein
VLPALLVSVAALAALALAPAAPPRLKLALAMLGLLAWFVPWSAIGGPVAMPFPVAQWAGEGGEQLAMIRRTVVATAEAAAPAIPSLSPWWLIVFVPGFLWFGAELWAYRTTVRRWRRDSRFGHELERFLPTDLAGRAPGIRVLADSSIAVAVGLIRPTVFIGERIAGEDALRAALTHECCHARRRDPLWLALVTLIARLYCFNPIALALKRQAILAIEAACDEECARRLGRPQYRSTLARLVLEREGDSSHALAPSLHTPGMNFTRLKLLGRGSRMDPRAGVAVGLVLVAAIVGVSWISAGSMGLRIGEWMEVTDLSHWGYDVAPVSRRFERLASGMTRVYAPDGAISGSTDFRCDGRDYPDPNVARQSQLTLACTAVDPWTNRYVTKRSDGSAVVADWTETVSRDGETMGLTMRPIAAGQTAEATRTFSRLR